MKIKFMSKKFRLPKVLKADLWDWSRKLLLVAAIMFVAMLLMRSVFYVIAFISLILLADVVVLIQLAFARTKVKNEFHQPIFVKKVGSDEVAMLEKGASMYDVEGIKVCNTVFDVSNCHTVVMPNAELKSSFRMWIDVKVTPPDESWSPLFKSFNK